MTSAELLKCEEPILVATKTGEISIKLGWNRRLRL